jgi:hypothetical protein
MTNFATTNRATILALRVCAARLDAKLTHEGFAQLVADFREAVESEAAGGTPKPLRCIYCGAETEAGHACDRMRELGFAADVKPPLRNDKTPEAIVASNNIPRNIPSAASESAQASRSTGAAEAEPKADIHASVTRAASVTPPAAPSTEFTAGAVSVLNRGADHPANRGNRHGPACRPNFDCQACVVTSRGGASYRSFRRRCGGASGRSECRRGGVATDLESSRNARALERRRDGMPPYGWQVRKMAELAGSSAACGALSPGGSLMAYAIGGSPSLHSVGGIYRGERNVEAS